MRTLVACAVLLCSCKQWVIIPDTREGARPEGTLMMNEYSGDVWVVCRSPGTGMQALCPVDRDPKQRYLPMP